MTTQVRHLVDVESPRDRELRERRARVKIRAQRVDRAGLEGCRICGGATDPRVDVSLACDCAAIVAHLEHRVRAIVDGRRADDVNLADIIAP